MAYRQPEHRQGRHKVKPSCLSRKAKKDTGFEGNTDRRLLEMAVVNGKGRQFDLGDRAKAVHNQNDIGTISKQIL